MFNSYRICHFPYIQLSASSVLWNYERDAPKELLVAADKLASPAEVEPTIICAWIRVFGDELIAIKEIAAAFPTKYLHNGEQKKYTSDITLCDLQARQKGLGYCSSDDTTRIDYRLQDDSSQHFVRKFM